MDLHRNVLKIAGWETLPTATVRCAFSPTAPIAEIVRSGWNHTKVMIFSA
jgi:hypothetical protein